MVRMAGGGGEGLPCIITQTSVTYVRVFACQIVAVIARTVPTAREHLSNAVGQHKQAQLNHVAKTMQTSTQVCQCLRDWAARQVNLEAWAVIGGRMPAQMHVPHI